MLTTMTDKELLDFYLFLKDGFYTLDFKREHTIDFSIDQCYVEMYNKIFQSTVFIPADREKLKVFNIYFEAHYQKLPQPSNFTCFNYLKEYFVPNSNPVLSHSNIIYFDGFAPKTGKNGDLGKIALIATLTLLTGFTFLALYYIISRSLNSVERFVYDENWLKATISIAAILAGAAAGACLGFYIVGPLIMFFGFMVLGMTNPLGLAIGGIVLTSILLAALTCVVTNAVQNIAFEKFNFDALDPKDAARFEITDAQEQALIEKGFDVDIVRCAIVALRNEMQVERVPSLLSRWMSSTPRMEKIKHNLELIRQLKNGSYDLEKQLYLPELNLTFNVKSQIRSNSNSLSEDDFIYNGPNPLGCHFDRF